MLEEVGSAIVGADADPNDVIVMRGWLEKHSVSAPPGLKNWRRRLLTLYTTRIEWRRDIGESAAGSLQIDGATKVKPHPEHLPPKCVSIITSGGTLSLRFDNDETLSSWVSAIQSCAGGKIENTI